MSVPSAVSDISSISDSPHTSPSTSPTPAHYQNMSDTDFLHPDSGIEVSGVDDETFFEHLSFSVHSFSYVNIGKTEKDVRETKLAVVVDFTTIGYLY